MAHTVKLSQFEGPLDLLLHLIEQEELDISQVALAGVCEAYLTNLAQVERRAPEDVADFLLVAAKLLYLKSLVLIPNTGIPPNESADATGLAEQLRIYRAFVHASRGIDDRYLAGPMSFGMERVPVAMETFLPPPRLTADRLVGVFSRIIAALEPMIRIPRAVVGRTISIDDRITEIRHLIATQPNASFGDILRGRQGSDQQIVSFLAILELVKQRELAAVQRGRFEPISIERIGAHS